MTAFLGWKQTDTPSEGCHLSRRPSSIPTSLSTTYARSNAPIPSVKCLNRPSGTRAPAGFLQSIANRESAVSLTSSARTCDGQFSRFTDSLSSTLKVWIHIALWLHPWRGGRAAEFSVANHPLRKGARQCFSVLQLPEGTAQRRGDQTLNSGTRPPTWNITGSIGSG